jgi:glycolate oxidase
MSGLVKDLARLIGDNNVLFQPEDLLAYANDATHYFRTQLPDAVVLPSSTQEIARVQAYAYEHQIPVTPRGAGSGLSGGATPVKGGIVVDTKRLNRIVEIDRANMVAQVEGGAVLQNFHRAVEERGLFYPPDGSTHASLKSTVFISRPFRVNIHIIRHMAQHGHDF